jgi:hypothetical protein
MSLIVKLIAHWCREAVWKGRIVYIWLREVGKQAVQCTISGVDVEDDIH